MSETGTIEKWQNSENEDSEIEGFKKWLGENQPKDMWEDKIDQLVELFGKYLRTNGITEKEITAKTNLFQDNLQKNKLLFNQLSKLIQPKNKDGEEEIFDPEYHLAGKWEKENDRYYYKDENGNHIPRPQPQPISANKTAKRKTLAIDE